MALRLTVHKGKSLVINHAGETLKLQVLDPRTAEPIRSSLLIIGPESFQVLRSDAIHKTRSSSSQRKLPQPPPSYEQEAIPQETDWSSFVPPQPLYEKTRRGEKRKRR